MFDIDIFRPACITGMGGLGVIASLIAGPPIIIGILHILGFRKAGVAAASFAARFQSIVYGGLTRGVFSILQAIGAKGAVGTGVRALVVIAGGIIVGKVASLFFWRG